MRDVFHPVIKYLYVKYCASHAEIPPVWDRMKNIPASCKRSDKFIKK